jgi:hypothetical protein
MAFSDIARGVGKSYLYTNLARDGYRLWNRYTPLDIDLDKRSLLRRVGVVPYEPGRRTASDLTLLIIGGIVGAAIALALAPKRGAELRNDVRDRAMNLLDQVKNRAQSRSEDFERPTA